MTSAWRESTGPGKRVIIALNPRTITTHQEAWNIRQGNTHTKKNPLFYNNENGEGKAWKGSLLGNLNYVNRKQELP